MKNEEIAGDDFVFVMDALSLGKFEFRIKHLFGIKTGGNIREMATTSRIPFLGSFFIENNKSGENSIKIFLKFISFFFLLKSSETSFQSCIDDTCVLCSY